MPDIMADLRELATDLDGPMPSVAAFVRMGAAEIERLRRESEDRKLMLSMLVAQVTSLGHEPVVRV